MIKMNSSRDPVNQERLFWLLASEAGKRSLTIHRRKNALIRLGEIEKKKNAEQWQQILKDNLNYLPSAVIEAKSKGVIPGHFKEWVNCQNCGPMLVERGRPLTEKAELVLFCEWCDFV